MLHKKKSRNTAVDKKINSAFLIYEQCRKLNLPKEAARIFVYIHFRVIHSLCGDIDHSDITHVIDFIIDNGVIDAFSEKSLYYDIIKDVPKKMNIPNEIIKREYSSKAFIFSEMSNRVRIHRDKVYRKKMIYFYRDKILPSLVYREMAS